MAEITVKIPGIEDQVGETPIVILGPNGSGKTKLAQKIAGANQVSAISAQRRTWVDDHLPVQTEQQLRNSVQANLDNWHSQSWQPTQEINYVLAKMVQEHTDLLNSRNEEALTASKPLDPVKDTDLIRLQLLWTRLFPARKLLIGGFFPKVKRSEKEGKEVTYEVREMSDGERTILYMAARVLTADKPIILVDEPELHMHSRLAVHFWNAAERLRPDCRFIYVTHDLNFTLSRRKATVLIARADSAAESVLVDELPSFVAPEILGAATLPFFAKRIVFYEAEDDKVFASGLLEAWFNDDETFIIPSGNRDSVCAAVSGLKKVGIAAAEVIGLVDRDFYSKAINDGLPTGVVVLPLHEIESILCDRSVVGAIACHLGKDPLKIWEAFLDRIRTEFTGKRLNHVIANRVRARAGDLLDGAFLSSQIVGESSETCENHKAQLSKLNLPNKTGEMFAEEEALVSSAISSGSDDMLGVLPGKHLLSLLTTIFGFKSPAEIESLVVQALRFEPLDELEAKNEEGAAKEASEAESDGVKLPQYGDHLKQVASELESAMAKYLPPRKAASKQES